MEYIDSSVYCAVRHRFTCEHITTQQYTHYTHYTVPSYQSNEFIRKILNRQNMHGSQYWNPNPTSSTDSLRSDPIHTAARWREQCVVSGECGVCVVGGVGENEFRRYAHEDEKTG
jgi:hypothetical protein